MRGAPTNVSNISFNDKEMFNPQTTHKHFVSKEDHETEREKQLSELREMVAKTYRVIGDVPSAERDIPKNHSKKHLFK